MTLSHPLPVVGGWWWGKGSILPTVLSQLSGQGCWPCSCPPPPPDFWGPHLWSWFCFPARGSENFCFVAGACCFRCCRGFAPSGANYPWGSQPIYQPGTWIMGVPWFKTALVVGSSLSSGGTDVFTSMPGERYRRRPMSLLLCLCYVRSLLLCLCYVRSLLLCLCYGFQGLINSLVFWFFLGSSAGAIPPPPPPAPPHHPTKWATGALATKQHAQHGDSGHNTAWGAEEREGAGLPFGSHARVLPIHLQSLAKGSLQAPSGDYSLGLTYPMWRGLALLPTCRTWFHGLHFSFFLRQWENVTCMGLRFRSTLDHSLGGMASLIK